VIPDSNWVAWGFVSSVLHLYVTVVDSDGVTSVEIQVFDTKHEITVVHQVLWLLHINIVLTDCRRVIVLMVMVAENGHRLVVEIVTTKLSNSVVDVVLHYFTSTSKCNESTPYDKRDHIPVLEGSKESDV